MLVEQAAQLGILKRPESIERKLHNMSKRRNNQLMPANSPPKKDTRVPVMMDAPTLTAIDDWAFARRIRSRGDAIRQLVKLGLEASAKQAKRDAD